MQQRHPRDKWVSYFPPSFSHDLFPTFLMNTWQFHRGLIASPFSHSQTLEHLPIAVLQLRWGPHSTYLSGIQEWKERCMMQNCKLWSSYPNRHQLEKVSVPTWKDCVKKCLRVVWFSVWDFFFFLATSQEQSSTWSVPMLGVPIKPPREVSSQLLTVSERDRRHFWPEMMAQTELSQEQRTSNTKVICPWSAHMAKQAEGDGSSRAWLQWRKECCHHCQASPAPDVPGSWAQPQDFELCPTDQRIRKKQMPPAKKGG